MKTILTILFLLLASPVFGQSTQTARFHLQWTNGAPNPDGSNTPTGTKVERSDNGAGGTFQQVGVVPWAGNAYDDSIANDTGGKIYCYRVKATNSAGDSAYSNTVCGASNPISPVSHLPASASGLAVAVMAPLTTPPK